MRIPLSVLDLSPVGVEITPSQAICNSIELAVHADRLGYHRYWFAEHHNMASIAASSPEVLIAYAAARTKRIRVGAGGIMVLNHTPLHVVEMFRTLEALAPMRVDLGLGRAPGTDQITSSALRRSDDPEVNILLSELLAFDQGSFPENHPFAKIAPMPSDVYCSSIWMLGSTLAGALLAAQIGIPYAFAGHFAMRHARAAISTYKTAFKPSPRLAKPYAMCVVAVICGPDDVAAQRLAAPARVAIVNTRTGKPAPVPSFEESLSRKFTPEEEKIADEYMESAVVGDPTYVGDRLIGLARELDADELMLSTLVPSLEARRDSLERVADVMR